MHTCSIALELIAVKIVRPKVWALTTTQQYRVSYLLYTIK